MEHGKYRFVGGFLLAPLVVYIVFVVSPYVQAFYISLTDWHGFSAQKNFVGLDNFAKLFHDDLFWNALEHNIVLLIVLPLVTIVLSLFFAFMLNVGGRGKSGAVQGVRGSGVYKIVYFFPYVLSIAIIAVLWQFIYNPRIGMLNGFLRAIGLDSLTQAWLGEPDLALWSIIAVMVWNAVGFYVVLFTAGMKTIPTDIYESALMDGAGRWSTFLRITLPLLWDSVQTALVYLGIIALDAFAVVQIMTFGGPDNSTEVVGHYLYTSAFKYSDFGYASAMGVALFVLTMLLAALTLRVTRRESVEF